MHCQKKVLSLVAHVLGKSELQEWCDLYVHNLREAIRKFMVNFLVGEPIFAHVKFVALSFVSLLCYVFMNVCRFLFMHVRLVLEGGLANQYDMVWATCMHGMGVMMSFVVPSIVSESTLSVPLICVRVLTFLLVIMCRNKVTC